MLRATLKSLLSRKLRLLLSGFAVVLAVMFVAGSFVLSDTLGRTFDSMFTTVYDYTDIQVQGKPKVADDGGGNGAVPQNIDSGLVHRVAAVPGVKSATGVVFADGARIVGKNRKLLPSTGPRFGASWTGEDNLVKLREGHGPETDDQIAVNAAVAKAGDFHLGDQVAVVTIFQAKKTFTLVGIFGYVGGRDSIGGAQVVAFTEGQAQRLMLGEAGAYNVIDVKVSDKRDLAQVRDALRAELGAQYRVDTGKELAKQGADRIKKFLSYINYVLLGFAAVALLVGVFLIINTFSIIVAQRTQELALLRAMGASRGQMIGSVLLEASLVGAIASTIGLGLGVGIGTAGTHLLAAFTSGGGLEVASLGVPAVAIISSYVVGVGVTMLAALLPAFRAARVAPVAAMRAAAATNRSLTRLTGAGAGLFAIGGGALWFGLSGKAHGHTLWWILAGVLVSFIAVALLTPWLSGPIVSVLGRLFAWSVPGQLGRRNSARNPRRTAITAAALMIGVALVTAVSTIFSSAGVSIGHSLDEQLKADLVIFGQQTSAIPPTIEAAALDRVRALSDVEEVSADSYDRATINGKDSFVLAVDDLEVAARTLLLTPKAGSLRTLASGDFVVDESVAKTFAWKIGDTVTVQLSRGEARPYHLVGTYSHSVAISNGEGIVLSWDDATTGFRSPAPIQAFVKLKPGASTATAKKQIGEILADSPEVDVLTRADYVGQITQTFDIVLGIVQVLLGVAMLIAVLGIVNTLVLSVLERTRELGLLRAIGLRRAQVMRMITVESVVISLFGALLGIVVGAGLGSAIVRALKDQGFTDLALPWGLMVSYLFAGALVGVVAAVLPAIRAARLNVLNAIAYE